MQMSLQTHLLLPCRPCGQFFVTVLPAGVFGHVMFLDKMLSQNPCVPVFIVVVLVVVVAEVADTDVVVCCVVGVVFSFEAVVCFVGVGVAFGVTSELSLVVCLVIKFVSELGIIVLCMVMNCFLVEDLVVNKLVDDVALLLVGLDCEGSVLVKRVDDELAFAYPGCDESVVTANGVGEVRFPVEGLEGVEALRGVDKLEGLVVDELIICLLLVTETVADDTCISEPLVGRVDDEGIIVDGMVTEGVLGEAFFDVDFEVNFIVTGCVVGSIFEVPSV